MPPRVTNEKKKIADLRALCHPPSGKIQQNHHLPHGTGMSPSDGDAYVTIRGTESPISVTAPSSSSSSSYLVPPNNPSRAHGVLEYTSAADGGGAGGAVAGRWIDNLSRCGCGNGMGDSVRDAGAESSRCGGGTYSGAGDGGASPSGLVIPPGDCERDCAVGGGGEGGLGERGETIPSHEEVRECVSGGGETVEPLACGVCEDSARTRSSSMRRSAALRATFSACTSLSSSSASARLMRSTATILFA